MSIPWTACRDDLRRRRPDLSAEDSNKLLNAIWYNPALKQQWLDYYQYNEFEKMKQNPKLKKKPNYEPPDLNSLSPDMIPPKKAPKKRRQKKEVVESSSSSESEEEESSPSRDKAKSTVKNSDYYKKKYYKAKMSRK